MLDQILFFLISLLLGVFAGTISGITPGVHINLVASLIPSLTFLSFVQPIFLVVFVTSMAITHTFTDFIPSIFLGAPDSDTALGVLPGHRFLLKGQGHYALKLTIIGSVMGVLALIIVVPLMFLFLDGVYPFFQRMMAFFLIWAVIFLIMSEGLNWKRSLIIFLLSGIFGFASLNLGVREPLLPILSGLFGTSTLINSFKSNIKIPLQEKEDTNMIKSDIIKPSIITLVVSPLCSIFPGLGSSEAAVLGSRIGKGMNEDQFLILLGSINTLVMAVSFITLFLIGKSRSGAAVAISSLMKIGQKEIIIIFLTILLVSIIASFITLKLSRFIAGMIVKLNYAKVSLLVILLVCIITILISGILGFFVLIISTLIGLTSTHLGVRRSFLMGCLLIPTITYYLPFKII